jgi:hypothetical protein
VDNPSEEVVESYRRVLGLGSEATVDDVRRCYRREMRRWHPDREGGSEERAKLLNAARDYLVAHPEQIARPRQQVAVVRRQPDPPRPAPTRAPAPRTPRTPVMATAGVPATSRGLGDTLASGAAVVWMVLSGALQVLRLLVIVYFVLVAIAVVGWLLTVGLPWALRVLG